MKNRVALITGASRGIGRAISLAFAKAGYHIVITCLQNKQLLSETADEIKTCGVDCLSFVGDISDRAFVASMFESVAKRFQKLDVLVNNAGISHVGLLSDTKTEDWDRIIGTNLSSVYYCSSCALPMMLPYKSGHILNISSMWGTVGASCEVAYSASKGGVDAFTKALAKELAPSSISVNAIACGVIDTDMNRCFSEGERLALAEEIPAGRFGTPQEVASLALSIVSQSAYLTGQIIRIDGGMI